MKTNQALIKKEVLVLGKKLFIPVWIMGAIYSLLLIGIILSLLIPKSYMQVDGQEMTLEEVLQESLPVDINQHSNLIIYVLNRVMAVMLSVLLLINLSITTSKILYVNRKENYELFHRTQPVSIWRITISKLIAVTGSNWLVFFVISIINFLIINIFLSIQLRTVLDWNFWYGFVGLIQWALPAIIISAILVAFGFFISALFQEASTGKAIGIILGLHFVSLIFNRLYNWNIPSPFQYFQSLISIADIGSLEAGVLENFALPGWSAFFSWTTLLHIIVGAVFYFIATELYSKREIQ